MVVNLTDVFMNEAREQEWELSYEPDTYSSRLGDFPIKDKSPDSDAPYMEGYHLNVDELINNEILLNWPVKILCREDCKGICPVCGSNLNKGECGCDAFVPDPRMAAIGDIFNANKEV